MKRGWQRKPGTEPVIAYRFAECPNPKLKGPCHVWYGSIQKGGYGSISYKGKHMLAHRYVWEQTNGPIPSGLEIDHMCRVRSCCNADHLRVVTHKVNTTENSYSVGAKNKPKTHCPSGHAYDASNTRINKAGSRVCCQCQRDHGRKSYAKRACPRIPPTHCPQGHEYDAENTYTRTNGVKSCRTCHRKCEARRRLKVKP